MDKRIKGKAAGPTCLDKDLLLDLFLNFLIWPKCRRNLGETQQNDYGILCCLPYINFEVTLEQI